MDKKRKFTCIRVSIKVRDYLREEKYRKGLSNVDDVLKKQFKLK